MIEEKIEKQTETHPVVIEIEDPIEYFKDKSVEEIQKMIELSQVKKTP
jgi:hypothetical protein